MHNSYILKILVKVSYKIVRTLCGRNTFLYEMSAYPDSLFTL